MSLAAVELTIRVEAIQADRLPSEIQHHGTACCRLACAWLEGVDASWHGGRACNAPPAWIVQRWKWGGLSWPLHWCQIPEADVLDCGALAALCAAMWRRRTEGIIPVQLIQRYAAQDTIHWAATWRLDELETAWLDEDLAYHEVVGRVRGGSIDLWDSTDAVWLKPTPAGSYGHALSVRASGSGSDAETMLWGSHVLPSRRWAVLLDAWTPRACAQTP